MSEAKTLIYSPLAPRLILWLLLAILNGCSTHLIETNTKSEEGSNQTKSSAADAQKSSQTEPSNEIREHHTDSKPLCVYETIKGIAEVTEIAKNVVTFKFYPGDQYFKIPLNQLPSTEIKLKQELKAIARSPISGPCESDEFELLTSVE